MKRLRQLAKKIHHQTRSSDAMVSNISRHNGAAIGVIAIIAFVSSGLTLQNHSHFVSHEVKFADATQSNLSIIPASGVSEAGYQAVQSGYQAVQSGYQATESGYQAVQSGYQATESGYQAVQSGYQATESGYQGSQSGYQAGQSGYQGGQSSYSPVQTSYAPGTCWDGSQSSRTGVCPACPEGFAKSGLQCIPPSSPTFEGFTTTQGFTASGHLEVHPSLVRSGDPSRVYWNVSNVRDCTVRGSNGDGAAGGEWNMLSSGASGVVTSAIGSRTDYTLFCHSRVGATPSTITETRSVNVIPRWYEPSGQ